MKAANKAMLARTITPVSRGGIVGFSNTGNGRRGAADLYPTTPNALFARWNPTPDHRTRNASLRDALLYLQRCTFIRPVSELVRDLVELKLVESRYNKMPCDVDFKSSTRCSLIFSRAP